jgi:TonB family protein
MNLEMKRFYVALGLSLIFHLLQYVVVNKATLLTSKLDRDLTDIEIIETPLTENTPKSRLQEKKIINLPKQLPTIESDKPANFFAENDHRVEKETAVRKYGINNNQNRNAGTTNTVEKNVKLDTTDSEPEFARAIRQSSGSPQESAIQHELPREIESGTTTNLNTDSNIYATFYNRVEDLFYFRWVQRIDAIFSRLSLETKQNLAGQVWKTDIEVWLTSKGEYHKSFVMKPSGFQNFDNAVVFAFENARFFPNPPKGKIDSDGFVRLRYRFNLHVR